MALPYHWAAPMATMAVRAGKDVYCEKPIAITVREGRNLIETCQRFGRIYQAGMQQRSEYGGKFRLACELVRNGRIGQLKEVYAYRQPGAFFPTAWTSDDAQPVPEGFDWDLWLGPLPWRPYAGGGGPCPAGVLHRRRELEPAPLRHHPVDGQPRSRRPSKCRTRRGRRDDA